MIRISESDRSLIVESFVGEMAPRHESQLAFWGFSSDKIANRFETEPRDIAEIAGKVSDYFEKCGLRYEIERSLEVRLANRRRLAAKLSECRNLGAGFKGGVFDKEFTSEFVAFLRNWIPRTLKAHQIKAALHLLAVENGANFSVPGSGKTTVVLTVFEFLRRAGVLDALFVVGPPACFGPWRDEYKAVLGKRPTHVTLAGGDADDRRSKYLVNASTVKDLYLTSFHTLLRDWDNVRTLLSCQGIQFYLVIDEAHYIKQLDGSWAAAALRVSRAAGRRCILTGTPFPKSYTDAFNLFDFLWPECPPISQLDRQRVSMFCGRKDFDQASRILDRSISPLFYRVRKSDLGLATQVFHDPIIVQMNEYERKVYDSIMERVRLESQQDYFRDLNVLLRLRRGRMMRLRQCISYAKMVSTVLDDYEEDLLAENESLASVIQNYDALERPGKISTLLDVVHRLRAKGEKVVIWSSFVKTLQLIMDVLLEQGLSARLIYGGTPLHRDKNDIDNLTREQTIREFVSETSGIDILVANPAACAESISLHKTCSNAIYYDLSYNCAQYLQSLDRIHRVGGSEQKPSYYYFLQYDRSLDQDILKNVVGKAERMSHIVDQDYPIYSLDMFDLEDEHAAYIRLFSNESKSVQ